MPYQRVRGSLSFPSSSVTDYRADYGGNLPFLTDLDNPLRPGRTWLSDASAVEDETPLAISHQPASMLNPFCGYPATSTRGYPGLHHNHRRKRDLARTLAWLFWLRWRSHILVVVVLTLTCNFAIRKGSWRIPETFLGWRTILSSYYRDHQKMKQYVF